MTVQNELKDAAIGILGGLSVAVVLLCAQLCWQPPLMVMYCVAPLFVFLGLRDEVQYCFILRHFVCTLIVLHIMTGLTMIPFNTILECRITFGINAFIEAVVLGVLVNTPRGFL